MKILPLTSSSRVRARPTSVISATTHRPIFRIESQDGVVLRRIASARTPVEAIAHYWRSAGGSAKFSPEMPEMPPDATLRRRIEAARSARGRAPRDLMRTHELPLPPVVEDDEASDAEAPEPAVVAKPKATRARRTARPKAPHDDLFESGSEDAPATDLPPDAEAVADIEPVAAPVPEPVAAVEQEHEPDPEPEPAAEQAPAPEPVRPGPPANYHLDPQEVVVQLVDHRNLRPTDRSDSYLYHVTTRSEANPALRNGVVVSANDPIILTERQGVAYWLSVLADDFDYILDGPADFVVLRMRRFAVEGLLEADPYASRSAGCSCYLLTGGPPRR